MCREGGLAKISNPSNSDLQYDLFSAYEESLQAFNFVYGAILVEQFYRQVILALAVVGEIVRTKNTRRGGIQRISKF